MKFIKKNRKSGCAKPAVNLRKSFFILLPLMVLFCARPAAADTVVVAMGDSITAGTPFFLAPIESPPEGRGKPEAQYIYWLAKNFPQWKFFNRGVNGQRTDQILKRLRKDLEQLKPQIVIVLAGVNDLYQGYDIAHVRENLQAMYDLAEKNGSKVVVCTILPYDEASPEILTAIRSVNAWVEGYAEARGHLFCDTYAVAEDPEKPGKLSGSPDGLHPDLALYRKIGEALAKVLKAAYEK